MSRIQVCGLILSCISLLVAAGVQAQERTPALDALIKAAQEEKSLNIVWGPSLGAAAGARGLQDGLNKKYGTSITVNYTPGPSFPQMASRVVQEIQAGRPNSTDVSLGAETTISSLLEAKALMSVKWGVMFPHIRPEMQTNNGEAVHIVSLFTGIYYNTKFIKPNEVPKKMADVFNPKWKGRIATTPYAGTFDRLALAQGIDTIRPIVKKTSEWAGGLIRCGEYERLATGEFILFFFDCGRGDERLSVANGGPLEQAILDDAAITTNWFLGVPLNTTKPNLAKLFVAFVATPEGQAIIQKYGFTSSHFVEGTPANQQAKELEAKGVKVLTQMPDYLMEHQVEIEKYREEFQKMVQTK
jgi:iron(III) transport system substrate-binding protein